MVSERGAELLREVANTLREHPERHDQENWCGTACCIAGHVVRAAGLRHLGLFECYDPEVAGRRPVPDVAEELLGLRYADRVDLFAANVIPDDGLTWPEALEKIAAGTPIDDVITATPIDDVITATLEF